MCGVLDNNPSKYIIYAAIPNLFLILTALVRACMALLVTSVLKWK